jgi:hypothetical protein
MITLPRPTREVVPRPTREVVRRHRVQQKQLGHRGRKPDPLYRIRSALRAGADRLTARQIERNEAGLQAGDTRTSRSPSPGAATSS